MLSDFFPFCVCVVLFVILIETKILGFVRDTVLANTHVSECYYCFRPFWCVRVYVLGFLSRTNPTSTPSSQAPVPGPRIRMSVLQSVAESCSVLQCVALCCSVLQCAAVCCSVLQCAAVCCSVLQCVAVCRSVPLCVAVCRSVLQRVAACCSVLQRVAACCSECIKPRLRQDRAAVVWVRPVVCYSVLQCVAVCCSVLQCDAVCCSLLQ